MHPYATDSKERTRLPIYLGILSIFSAWLLPTLFDFFFQVEIPWWIEAPSVFGFYELYFFILNNYLWKASWIRKIPFLRIPNINGDWQGFILSSYDEDKTKTHVNVKIIQTWTELDIYLDTEMSSSHSLTASFLLNNVVSPLLSYEYLNEPKASATPTMHMHRGVSRLNYDAESNELNGEYYSGRDRGNFGTIHLKKSKMRSLS